MGRREVLVQLDDELVGRLDRLAATAEVSRSELLRRGALAVIQVADLAEADQELELVAAYRRQPQDPAIVQAAARLAAQTAPEGWPARRSTGPTSGRRRAGGGLRAQPRRGHRRAGHGHLRADHPRHSWIRSEVGLGPEHGITEVSAISCDNLLPQAALDPAPIGRLDAVKRAELDRALRYALDTSTEGRRTAGFSS